MTKEEWADKVIDLIARVGIPAAICAALLYELHKFFSDILTNQIIIIKNQEAVIDFIHRSLR